MSTLKKSQMWLSNTCKILQDVSQLDNYVYCTVTLHFTGNLIRIYPQASFSAVLFFYLKVVMSDRNIYPILVELWSNFYGAFKLKV